MIQAREIEKLKTVINNILVKHTKQPISVIGSHSSMPVSLRYMCLTVLTHSQRRRWIATASCRRPRPRTLASSTECTTLARGLRRHRRPHRSDDESNAFNICITSSPRLDRSWQAPAPAARGRAAVRTTPAAPARSPQPQSRASAWVGAATCMSLRINVRHTNSEASDVVLDTELNERHDRALMCRRRIAALWSSVKARPACHTQGAHQERGESSSEVLGVHPVDG